MRISDWSSDVCSSDLTVIAALFDDPKPGCRGGDEEQRQARNGLRADDEFIRCGAMQNGHLSALQYPAAVLAQRAGLCAKPILRAVRFLMRQRHQQVAGSNLRDPRLLLFGAARVTDHARSEETTSELQSLMRISYAVFCLKKK